MPDPETIVTALPTFSLSALGTVENLTYDNGAAVDANFTGTGNALSNTITGGTGNDKLDGKVGADTLIGHEGDDTYVIDNLGDVVDETGGSGNDLVQSAIGFSLSDIAHALGEIERLTLLGTAAINGTGNNLDNTITGNAGANIIEGKEGADTLDGSTGVDTLSYATSLAGVTVTLKGSTISVGAGGDAQGDSFKNFENIVGSAQADILTGDGAANVLDGGAGADTLAGGLGSDTYVVDDLGDSVTEGVSGGTDLVKSSVSFTLGDNVENLTLLGAANLSATGNALANVLTGNDGDNLLDGKAGADTMIGGLGTDTYFVDSTADKVIELDPSNWWGQQDTIVTSLASYSLATLKFVEKLVYDNGTALDANFTATGNASYNTLEGGAGNDRLDGGANADILIGHAGDDTYFVDSEYDQAVEAADEGTDTVFSSVSFSMMSHFPFWNSDSYIENLTLTGTLNTNGFGNQLDNIILGNSANNIISGGAGHDTLDGGAGSDTISFEGLYPGGLSVTLSGATWVTVTIGATDVTTFRNFENIIGSDGADVLTGDSGANVLNGGFGEDTLIGGLGNDTYVIDSPDDTLVEFASGGIDTVIVNYGYTPLANYTLLDNFENLTLADLYYGSLTGNALANILTGNGNDNRIDGGAGADTMIGGRGSDTYIVDDVKDKIVEDWDDNGAIDTIVTSLANFTLAGPLGKNQIPTGIFGIEKVVYDNGAAPDQDFTFTNNGWARTLVGGGGNDKLYSSIGNGRDTLIGGAGNDLLVGGEGSDILDGGDGTDTATLEWNSKDVVASYDAETNTVVFTYRLWSEFDTFKDVEFFQFKDVTVSLADVVAALEVGAHGVKVDGTPTDGANPWIDSLTWGGAWADGDGGKVTIPFAAVAGTNPLGAPFTGKAWTTKELAALNAAMSGWEAVANVDFVQVPAFAAKTWYWLRSDAGTRGTLGYHEVPGIDIEPLYSFFNVRDAAWVAGLSAGSRAFKAIVHELGHGLGLAHPHDGGDSTDASIFPGVTAPSGSYGDYNLNQGINTVMSYNDGWASALKNTVLTYGRELGPMALDIAAAQQLYGANMEYRTGSDVYLLPTANKTGTGWSCIWDAGGTDTISGATATQSCVINLQAAMLTGPNAGGFVSEVGRILGGFTIANGVLIENAVGGSAADQITGNESDNNLKGNGGNDTLLGNEGSDTLEGGTGNDTLTGGAGADLFVFNASTLAGDFGQDRIMDFEGGSGIGDRISVDDSWGFASALDVISAFQVVGLDKVLTFDTNTSITLVGKADLVLNLDDVLII